MTTELVPEQILPKVLTTFGLTAVYVFIICWITGSSVMATGGWQAIPFWVLGIVTFLVPAGLAVSELGNLWPGQGGVYIWAYRTMNDNWAFVGGFLSWVPVILNGASGPATVLQLLLLAFHAQPRHDGLGHPATGHPVGRSWAWHSPSWPPARR